MEIIINTIIYSALTLFIAYLGFRNIVLRRDFHNAMIAKSEAEIRRNILMNEYSNVLQELENKKLEKSDDFIKFLSDSRNSAFEYIESVQDSLAKFDKQITQIIKWNETYGTATGINPHSDKIKEISLAYKQLKELLPESAKTPND